MACLVLKPLRIIILEGEIYHETNYFLAYVYNPADHGKY